MIDYTLPLDELPDPLPIEPLTKPFDVTITPPGSKSITCRAYVLAALAEGESKIIRPLRADDTDKLLDALCTLGAEARWEGEDVYIKGVAGRFPRGGEVNLGDGGTPVRFMIACACLASEPVVVDGSPRMRERPVAEGVDMLRQLGATIEYVEEEGRLPVQVVPSENFKGGELEIGKTQSSQFISALLLIGRCLIDGISLRSLDTMTSIGYVNLTRDILEHDWNIWIHSKSFDGTTSIDIRSGPIQSRQYEIEPDYSSAIYWYCAAGINAGCSVIAEGLSDRSHQPDSFMLDLLASAGPRLEYGVEQGQSLPIRVIGTGVLKGQEIPCRMFPDGAVVYAAIASRGSGKTNLTGLHTLRVKETDRLAALENELTKIGCTVITTDDSITIDPSTRHNIPVTIETYNDHRMAMAFAVLGLARPGISIRNPKCVAKSYPGFWKDFASLYA